MSGWLVFFASVAVALHLLFVYAIGVTLDEILDEMKKGDKT